MTRRLTITLLLGLCACGDAEQTNYAAVQAELEAQERARKPNEMQHLQTCVELVKGTNLKCE